MTSNGAELLDAELVAAAGAGDTQAFMALMRRYHNALIASARQLTGNVEDAEDAVQETVIHAYRHLHTLRDAEKFRAWFFAILRRECLNRLRSQPREQLSFDACDDLPALPPDEGNDYREMLARLPLATRELLTARYFYDLSYDEMATIFDSTAETMRVRCYRARRQLRLLVEEEDEETRRILHGVMAALTVGFPLDRFLERIDHVVAHLAPPQAPPSPAVPTAGAAAHASAGTGFWAAHLITAKLVTGTLTALVLGTVMLAHLPKHHYLRHIQGATVAAGAIVAKTTAPALHQQQHNASAQADARPQAPREDFNPHAGRQGE